MRIIQGACSYLPDLRDEEIDRQLDYALGQGWALSVEFTDDPHRRNNYWDMWGLPMFGLADPAGALHEINECREAYPDRYIRVCAYDARPGRQTGALSFLVNRPAYEPGFRLDRMGAAGRQVRHTAHPYALDRAAGAQYGQA